jgi:hypothetical protein
MRPRRLLAAVGLAAALAGCAYRPIGPHPLITDPAGTVDTTHGAVGAQTTPR